MAEVNPTPGPAPVLGRGEDVKIAGLTSKFGVKPAIWTISAVAILQRVVLLFYYQAVPYNDTPSYRRLADSILRGFDHYDGTRTPGYPLLLAIFGPDQSVWLAQLVMGLIITLLLFYIGWQISGQAWFGALAALGYTLIPSQIFFESNLLTETPTTFWIALTLAGVVAWLHHPKLRSPWLALGLGLTSSLAWLTRPLFIFLPFWTALFLLPGSFYRAFLSRLPFRKPLTQTEAGAPKKYWISLVAFTLPVVFLLAAWLGFIHERFHMWSLSTMSGYNMIQHTGSFFEYVPDEYAALRDTYIRYRDAHIAQYGTQTNTIWDAIPAMQKASGKSFYDLSRLLSELSVQLILQHPDLYLRNVAEGWWYFWRAPVYWSPDLFAVQAIVPALKLLVRGLQIGVFGCNLIFILTTAAAAVWKKFRHMLRVPAALWFLVSSVWITSILQTILDHGDNPRFLIPMQAFVMVWVLWVMVEFWTDWKKMRLGRVPAHPPVE